MVIRSNRIPRSRSGDETYLTNNDIVKRVSIALSLKKSQIGELIALGGYEISRSELEGIMNGVNHKNYRRCSDAVLAAFLGGLILKYRGSK